jgi:hypothetical protein
MNEINQMHAKRLAEMSSNKDNKLEIDLRRVLMDCPDCNGLGEIREYYDEDDKDAYEATDCGLCGRSGYVKVNDVAEENNFRPEMAYDMLLFGHKIIDK